MWNYIASGLDNKESLKKKDKCSFIQIKQLYFKHGNTKSTKEVWPVVIHLGFPINNPLPASDSAIWYAGHTAAF